MPAEAKYTKWGIWEVHQSGFPDPPYYIRLPQYGLWDTEREARDVAQLLTWLDPEGHALSARDCGPAPCGEPVHALA